jgi:thiazole/oxazole-forming peptide maturase SagD family component
VNPQARPVLIVPAVPHGSGIRFLHPDTQYDIAKFVDEIQAVLDLSDGHHSAAAIAAAVHEQFPAVRGETIQSVISDLTSLGVLADSHEADAQAHESAVLLMKLWQQLVGRRRPVRVAKITGRPQPGAQFYSAASIFAPGSGNLDLRSRDQRSAGGTASSGPLALIKAIAEAYERHASGLVRIDVTSRARDLSEPWLDPRRLVPLTHRQFDRLPHLQPFTENQTRQWVRGFHAVSGAGVLVPAELVFYPLTAAMFGRPLSYRANSSGVAAFTNEPEAIRRGLLELIERDAIMQNWFQRTPPQRLAAAQLPDHVSERIGYWQSRGYATQVLDLSRHGVMTVLVLFVSPSQYPSFVAGAAASYDSFHEALAKAFQEAEFGLISTLAAPKNRRIQPQHVAGPADHAKLYNHPHHLSNLEWLWRGPVTKSVPRASASYEELLKKLNPTVVRLSPPDASLAVVRVLSDKLVPINFGYGTEHISHASVRAKINPENVKLPHYFA